MKIRTYAALGLGLALPLIPACSSSNDTESFEARNSQFAVAGSTVVAISARNIAFLADEATSGPGSSMLNIHDTDTIDSVAIVIDAAAKTETNLQVAANALAWIGDELYLVVNETSDNFDWNSAGGITNVPVLLHWSKALPTLQYIDTLATTSGPKMAVVDSTLFYSSATAPVGPMASNLWSLTTSSPLVPVQVLTTDTIGPLSPQIVRAEEDLLFLTLDETVEGRNLNNATGAADSDSLDTAVLALLDGTVVGDPIHVVGYALPSASSPLRAKKTATSDWQVGFLVNEAAQNATNLNDPSLFAPTWYPSQCTVGTHGDLDTNDDVLHYLRFDAWTTNPGANPIRNTGFVGVDKIAIANGFIATITPENASAGTLGEGTCDLNQDTDRIDRIARWTKIESGTAPIVPFNSSTNLHALFDCPGGTHGLAELDGRFVIVVSENQDGRDLNGDTLTTFNLVGELQPTTSVNPFDFAHSADQLAVGASWLSEQPDRRRLNVAYEERVFTQSLNVGTTQNPGDNDILDSVPTFPDFAGSVLMFPGSGLGLDLAQPGILSAKTTGFYRVDEAADNRRWNSDADKTDKVLLRTSFVDGRISFIAALNSLNTPAVYVNLEESAPRAGAFLTEESGDGAAGTDHNDDGDQSDLVLRWFTF